MIQADVEFVAALPGWDVLYYMGEGVYESVPVISWALLHDADGYLRTVAVTPDLAWNINADRIICTPDGQVFWGDDEGWPCIAAWLDAMKERGEAPMAREVVEHEPVPVPSGVAVLSNFRKRFEEGQ
jgi:hypothetical protein